MAINQKDIKLLWGRAANRCSICKIELTQDSESVSSSFTLGEQAHIVGEKDSAARGISKLSVDDRNSYHNLILLCPTHHTEIDKNEPDWPVSKLHFVKSKHELWVSETLGKVSDRYELAKQVAVTSIIDSAVTFCKLENWISWTSFALAPDPQWSVDMPKKLYEFRLKVLAAVWPEDFDELKRASQTLAILLNMAAQTFLEHAQPIDDTYYPHKFYKDDAWNENYDQDLAKYNNWLDRSIALVRDATKAANWFADVVRRDINPMFFAKEGKFLTMEGDIRGWEARLWEYTTEERNILPDALLPAK